MDRVQFKGKAHTLLYQHKLSGWKIVIKQMRRHLGLCEFSSRTLSFDDYHVEHSPDSEVMNTLLHEIAHALVGHAHGHDAMWKAMAVQLGARPVACGDVALVAVRPGSWRAVCPHCHRKYYKHRPPKYFTGHFCIPCGKILGALQWLPHYEEET